MMIPLKKKKLQQQIDKQLIPRLGIIGSILILFGVLSVIYGFMVHPIPKKALLSENDPMLLEGIGMQLVELVEDQPNTLLPENILNFYLVAVVFGSIGSFCIYIASIKKKLKNSK